MPEAQGSSIVLPHELAATLSGHEGAVLNVRFNRKGSYCLSCGKVSSPAAKQRSMTECNRSAAGLSACNEPSVRAHQVPCRTAQSGYGTLTRGSASKHTLVTAMKFETSQYAATTVRWLQLEVTSKCFSGTSHLET